MSKKSAVGKRIKQAIVKANRDAQEAFFAYYQARKAGQSRAVRLELLNQFARQRLLVKSLEAELISMDEKRHG